MLLNLVSISIRNLSFPSDIGMQDTFYVLRNGMYERCMSFIRCITRVGLALSNFGLCGRLADKNQKPFYISEVSRNTCNPPWARIDSRVVHIGSEIENNASQLILDVFAIAKPKETLQNREAIVSWDEQYGITLIDDATPLPVRAISDSKLNPSEDMDDDGGPTQRASHVWPNIRHLLHREIDLQSLYSLELSGDVDRAGAAPAGLMSNSQLQPELEQTFAFIPLNSILIELGNDLYSDREVFEAIHNCSPEAFYAQRKYSKRRSNERTSYADELGGQRRSIAEDMEDFRQPFMPKSEATARINESLQNLEHSNEETLQLQRKREKIRRLENLKARLKGEIDEERSKLDEVRKSNEVKCSKLEEAKASLEAMKQCIYDQDKKLNEAHSRYWYATILLTRQQRHLIASLRKIYPIECKETGIVYTIRGLPLTKADVDSGQEQRTSTALGYIAHLVILLSKYLLIPLRYMPRPMASRSTIVDFAIDEDKDFPLYWKGSAHSQRFRLAYYMLLHDVLQLLFAVGIKPPNGGKHILECLQKLFFHFYEPEGDYSD